MGGKLGSSVGDAVGRREGSIVGYTFRKRQAINATGWPRDVEHSRRTLRTRRAYDEDIRHLRFILEASRPTN